MSLFLEKVADTPALRILEYFLEARETDHAVSDVIAGCAISRSTFYGAWPRLLQNEYVVQSRVVGKTKLFKLHERNPYVQEFLRIFTYAMKERRSHKIRV
jgi:DNA-binding IclR family transcriptional regulator